MEATPHWHVACRRCPEWWLELMLFDPTAYEREGADAGG